MFVEEGFRIRFANGEVIDFYADTAADKDGWMQALSETVGKSGGASASSKAWTQIVLKQEQAIAAKRTARSLIPEPGPRKCSKQMTTHDQSNSPTRSHFNNGAQESMMHGALPSQQQPGRVSPDHRHQQPRPAHHSRIESYQEKHSGIAMQERLAARKENARSMADMKFT